LVRIISVKYQPTDELLSMMEDYRNITNHLLSYALFKRIGSPYDLYYENRDWFDAHYKGKYAVHYLYSCSSFAMSIARSWRRTGRDRLPHLKKPVARLDQCLVKIKRLDEEGVLLRVTIAPWQYAFIDLKIHHKKWSDWRRYKIGGIAIGMNYVHLPVQVPDHLKVQCVHSAGVDLNIERATIATSDGIISDVDLRQIRIIRHRMHRKRESIIRAIPKNLSKQRKVIQRYRRREHDRVEDTLRSKSREIVDVVGQRTIILENLRNLGGKGLRKPKWRLSRGRLSHWPYSRLHELIARRCQNTVQVVSAFETSSFDPFCGASVTHPRWHVSLCPNDGLYDRDRLAAVAILYRGHGVLRGNLFTPSVVASLREQSALGQSEMARLENRDEAMTGNAPNTKEKSKGFRKR